ncbi:MAG: hypothetical protein HKO57_04875 [Akkermansiaceae bacterium]|nr:hypothetical protein [Akkermansiaceae bacterium]
MNTRIATAAATIVLAAVLASCNVHRQQRVNISEIASLGSIAALQAAPKEVQVERRGTRAFEVYDELTLAHVEFDDQGKFWQECEEYDRTTGTWEPSDRTQLDALEDYVDREIGRGSYRNGAMMIVFVHGWFNNSKEGNHNLRDFRRALEGIRADVAEDRPVLGIYLSWRGGSLMAPGAKLFSYWDRKKIAHKIGQRDLGEAVTRIAMMRQAIIRRGERSLEKNARTRLIMMGHSFGGAALFSASSRFLEDELIALEKSNYRGHIKRRWDLLILANPAFEALRYEAVDRYTTNMMMAMRDGVRPGKYSQLPRVLVASARNDRPNQVAMPIGQTAANVFEARQPFEWPLMTKSIGSYDQFHTHYLDLVDTPNGGEARLSPIWESQMQKTRRDANQRSLAAYAADSKTREFGNRSFLDPFARVFDEPGDARTVLPCMVASVDPRIVDNHGGIWKKEFRDFLVNFLKAREAAALRAR